MKEKILNTLKEIGFSVEEIEDFGFLFQYEGTNLVYAPNSKDENFMNICAPGVTDIQENETSINIYELANKLNSELNYIKAYVMEGRLWIGYEMNAAISEDNLQEVLGHMICYLDAAVNYAKDIIENGNPDADEEDTSIEITNEELNTVDYIENSQEDSSKEHHSLISNFCGLWKRIKSKS